jgi:hypothetical protein
MLGLECHVIPRIFAIRPKPKPKREEELWRRMISQGKAMYKSFSMLGKEEVVLHFYCESEKPHLAPHPGYTFTRTTDFMREYGPMIAVALRLLQYAIKAAPLPVGEVIPSEIIDAFATSVDDFNEKLLEYTVSMLETSADSIDKTSSTKTHGDGYRFGSKVVMDQGMQNRFKGTLLVVCKVW